jgi:hypothetical protein
MVWAFIIFTSLFSAVALCALVLYLFSKANVRNYKAEDINDVSQYRKSNSEIPLPLNDPLARNKVYEKRMAEKLQNGVVKYNPESGLELSEEPQIVGLAEPQGFWTRFIMGQKLGYIKMRMSLRQEGGSFWTTLVNAQAANQGKSKGRGR